MKISRTVSYAIQATIQLARAGGDAPTPCSRLAAEGEMPERFLLQILRNLVRHGILESTRGVDGGYRLVRNADSISLLEIIEAIDGPLKPGLAPRRGLPEDVEQNLIRSLESVTALCRRELEAIKISSLMMSRDEVDAAERASSQP